MTIRSHYPVHYSQGQFSRLSPLSASAAGASTGLLLQLVSADSPKGPSRSLYHILLIRETDERGGKSMVTVRGVSRQQGSVGHAPFNEMKMTYLTYYFVALSGAEAFNSVSG